MNKLIAFRVALVISAVAVTSTAAQPQPSHSLVGSWTAVSDEDGTPADYFQITEDGKYINYGFNCTVRSEAPTHIWGGDLYVTHEIPAKGPISIVFRPNFDASTLTFTSPRTRNNAVYARIVSIPCLEPSR